MIRDKESGQGEGKRHEGGEQPKQVRKGDLSITNPNHYTTEAPGLLPAAPMLLRAESKDETRNVSVDINQRPM